MNIYPMAKSKVERQGIIREVIRERRVVNQEELAAILEEKGMEVAQATLSRDMKEMKISKLHDESGYYYSLDSPSFPRRAGSAVLNSSESIGSVEFSGNMAVIKTRPGHANMVAAMVDAVSLKEIAGTIAGDDTLLLVIREGFSRDDLIGALGKLFRHIDKKRLN